MLLTIHLTLSDNLFCSQKNGMLGPCYKDDDKMKNIWLNYNKTVFYRAGIYALVQHLKKITEKEMGNTEK